MQQGRGQKKQDTKRTVQTRAVQTHTAQTSAAQRDPQRDHRQHQGSIEEPAELSGHHHTSTVTYWIVFTALMVLLALTWGASLFDFGPLNLAVALTIATIKAVIIILYFMHVKQSSRLIWLFAGASFFWVGIMIGFVFTDYLSRPILGVPTR